MRLRYGMRLGRGLGVSGGFGIVVAYVIARMIAFALEIGIKIGFLILRAIGLFIHLSITEKRLRTKRQADVALFQRIAAQRVKHVEYLRPGCTEPPALWGVFIVEPSYGPSYIMCGQHPGTLRKLWLENRGGTVRELMLLQDKPLAIALRNLLQQGVCRVTPNTASIVSGFAANDMPIFRAVQQ